MTAPTHTPPAPPTLEALMPSLMLAREQLTACDETMNEICAPGNSPVMYVWNRIGDARAHLEKALQELDDMGLTPASSAPVRLLDAVDRLRAEWQTQGENL